MVAVADIVVEGREATGGDGTFVKVDVSKAADVGALVNKVFETYGQIDYAFNDAGIEGPASSMVEYTEEEFDRGVAIDLSRVLLCRKYEIPHMLKQGGGAIVNTASVAGLVRFQGTSAYAANKHGENGLTKTAALVYAKSGIRVNFVCPGVIETPIVKRPFEKSSGVAEGAASVEPVGLLGPPEETAEAAVWFCSDAASFVTGVPMAAHSGLVAQKEKGGQKI